jgi:hypothetical protein
MDQLTSAAGVDGHALLIDCHTLDIEPIDLPNNMQVVVQWVAARTLVGSAYADRVSQCAQAEKEIGPLRLATVADTAQIADAVVRAPALHVVSENERVREAAKCLQAGDVQGFGLLMNESHESLRSNFAVSTEQMDNAVKQAQVLPGVYGARMTGGGFGGCIVMVADSDARLAFMSELAHTARQLDSTRLISAACLINREEFCIQDRLTAHLDVIGLNEYFGWYEPGFSGLQKLLANSKPDKPVLITETGADALAGHRGPQTALFTEDCQAFILGEQVRLNASFDYVCGIAPWLLYDFLRERRQTIFNRGFNRKGVIAQDKKTRKLGFYALKEAYAEVCRSKLEKG